MKTANSSEYKQSAQCAQARPSTDSSTAQSEAVSSLLGYSRAHQLACCRSLCNLGFGDMSLNRIEKYISNAQQWLDSLEVLTRSRECQFFFPDYDLSMRNITQLAQFYDARMQPPDLRLPSYDMRVVTRTLNSARKLSQKICSTLTRQQYWLDTSRLPLNQHTVNCLKLLLQTSHRCTATIQQRNAKIWFRQFLHSGINLESQLACGNVKKLADSIKQAVQFSENREYQAVLGAEFRGLASDWTRLYTNIRFYAEVQRVLEPAGLDQNVLHNWARVETRFMALCRNASAARRRLHKLNRLVKRQTITPATSSSYIRLARQSIRRLHIWAAVLQRSDPRSYLTPLQLLDRHLPRNSQIVAE